LILPCFTPRLGAFSAFNAFIVGALFRPAFDVIACIIAGAVDGGSIKALFTVYSSSSSSSSSSARRARKDGRGVVSAAALLTAGGVSGILSKKSGGRRGRGGEEEREGGINLIL
jgi:hypothetical protein